MPIIKRKQNRIKPVEYKHDNQSSKYYNKVQWRDLRQAYMIEHPLCERCLREGRTTLAEEVHHKQFILSGSDDNERLDLLLNYNNLESLCKKCHDELHTIAHRKNIKYIE